VVAGAAEAWFRARLRRSALPRLFPVEHVDPAVPLGDADGETLDLDGGAAVVVAEHGDDALPAALGLAVAVLVTYETRCEE